jgi:PAS domain S-box-containing protein
MGDSNGRENRLRVIFAVEAEEERSLFVEVMSASSPGCELFFPTNIAEVEALYSNDGADAIVTDFRFHSGALADWLTFWPLPAILLVDPADDLDRVGKTVRDEAALFAQRMPDLGHIRVLPLLIKKALNVRESAARQNAHLQMTEHQYMNLLQAVPDIVYILDGNGRFMYLNDAIRNIGYEPSRLIGRHFSEIVHPDDVAKVSRAEVLKSLAGVATGDDKAPKLFDERRAGKRMTRNLELRLKHGDQADGYRLGSVISYGEVSSSGYALPEFEGVDLGTVGIIRDITLRKERERALELALASKEVLLKEIHHRVKNNLQVVSSLLSIQGAVISDDASRKVFVECQTQIQTMSMVHDVLYHSSSFEGVEMQSYFEKLIDYLGSVYDSFARGVSYDIAARGVSLNLDEAIPVALIVNELVTNCMKHAFPEGKGGRIIVSMRLESEAVLLEVEDDGVGIGEEARRETPAERRQGGIGKELVEALAIQLQGNLERGSRAGSPGARVALKFPRSKG